MKDYKQELIEKKSDWKLDARVCTDVGMQVCIDLNMKNAYLFYLRTRTVNYILDYLKQNDIKVKSINLFFIKIIIADIRFALKKEEEE